MEINEKTIKLLSNIGSRASFGLTAVDLGKEIENLMILTSDVSTSAGLDRYKKMFPDKYLDVGIAEQNMIGVAAGLASENFNVITTTFAPFQTMRCCEQIKVNLGYMRQKVCMVGLASGLALGALGFTHCCIEDIGVMRSIPGITIISPADSLETVKSINAAINHSESTYVRLTGVSNNPIVYDSDYEFEIGKSIKLTDGSDVAIFCSGSMVYESLEASKILETINIKCSVINMHTIKPIDKDAIRIESAKVKLIVSIEEHNIIGGMGSAISEFKSTLKNSPPQIFIGVNDIYKKSGDYSFMKDTYGLTKDKIVENIKINFNKI